MEQIKMDPQTMLIIHNIKHNIKTKKILCICAWCNKVKLNQNYVKRDLNLDEYCLSHSICPKCIRKMEGEKIYKTLAKNRTVRKRNEKKEI